MPASCHTPRPHQNLVAALRSPSLFLFTVSPSHILLKNIENTIPPSCETSSGSAVASWVSRSLLHLAFKAFYRILSLSTPHSPSPTLLFRLFSPARGSQSLPPLHARKFCLMVSLHRDILLHNHMDPFLKAQPEASSSAKLFQVL